MFFYSSFSVHSIAFHPGNSYSWICLTQGSRRPFQNWDLMKKHAVHICIKNMLRALQFSLLQLGWFPCCCCSAAKSSLTLCDLVDGCMPGSFLRSLLSPRVCANPWPLCWWCHPNISLSVAFSPSVLNLSQPWGLFQRVSSLCQGDKVLELQLHH